ncbi:MAG: ABC transporter substrate-binding protein [Acetobacteraceae bacterium]|nr:ABC transporter substrate-binding protein [Acetobacteraceae bacterium]
MERRHFLKTGAALGVAAGAGGLSAPALSQGAAARTLRFVPQANLANFDPIWGTQFVVRNASMLVWDTLYGIDNTFTPRRQMVESEEVSADGRTWTFRLREGLRFHDGEPVRAADCVASLNRWAVRDGMGQMIRAIQEELVAVDDRTFRWRLRQPYPKMLLALGKNNTPIAFMMPERIARTDPFQQIAEFVGSGPMRFNRGEWVPGARATWSRFDQYVPRQEAPNWLSGGKRMLVDRVEWIIQPDPATAAAALQQGEVDWWETPLNDLLPTFRRNRNIRIEVADPLGNVGCLRFNHLHAPFNNPRIRQAVAMIVNQPDMMRAVIGDDSLWKQMNGFFTPETPNYTEAGGEILSRPRDGAAARRLLQEAGYNGEPVTMLVAQDIAWLAQMGQVANAALRSVGMNVDFVATDWGTVGARRASREPRERGGWNIFFTWFAGADCTNPASYLGLRAHGDGAWFGWPTDPGIEAGRDKWFAAANAAEEKAACEEINRAACQSLPFVPTGFFRVNQAFRSNVTGVVPGPLPWFWGVAKS